MSENEPKTHDILPKLSQSDSIDQSRRRLTGAALGVSAVFTLASRPVWASQCSISGMASGNLSRHADETCEGCSPGYWARCQHLSSWPAPYGPDVLFNTVFEVSQYINHENNQPFTLLEVMGLNGNGNCSSDEEQPNCSVNPNGKAIGNMGCDPISVNLGFHAVAALLSAAHPHVNYGYTAGEVITLFQANYLSNPAELTDSLAMLNERSCPLG